MDEFGTIFRAKKRRIKNYLSRRLDTITRIELLIFLVVAIAFYLDRVNLKLYWVLRTGGEAKAWNFFIGFSKIIYAVVLLAGLSQAHRKLKSPQWQLLLFQPLSIGSFVKVTVFDLFIPVLLFYPLWLASLFIFVIKLHVSFQFALYWIFIHSLVFFLSASGGIAGAIIFRETRCCPQRKIRIAGTIVTFVVIVFLIFRLDGLVFHYWFFLFVNVALSGLAVFLLSVSLAKQYVYFPEHFGSHPKKSRHYFDRWFLQVYLLVVPRSQQSIVRKDSLFALRRYKSFWIIFLFMIVMTTGGMLTISGIKNASSWLLFSNIFAAFLIANASFKFNLENIEFLQIIKMHPVRARHYWWGKFWVGFTPLLWLIIYGTILLVLRQGMDIAIIAGSFSLSLFFAFTLIFIQNNFSLYSYPYSRYAPLWYNLYIALAVAFFTVFLFPPLTIAFLFFGYYAIFRVLRRIKNLEIL
ncbi:MAG: hypothetical protein GWP06_14020 [Actinobacteria bacterium]|nr:hypothetical protein [Actinomycetota bacterium]